MLFQKGQSGNPAGRPRGSRNRSKIIADKLTAPVLEKIVDGVAKKAMGGNLVAARLVLNMLAHVRRDERPTCNLPALNTPGDVLAAMQNVARDVSSGALTAGQGADIGKILDLFLQAHGHVELEGRLRQVERQGRHDPSRRCRSRCWIRNARIEERRLPKGTGRGRGWDNRMYRAAVSSVLRVRREHRYVPRAQFVPFHARTQRFACIVSHRRAGKTVACIHELRGCAVASQNVRPRFAYVSPFLKQSKTVAWDYLRGAVGSGEGSINHSELRVDYHNGGQVRLYGADNPDALRGIYLDGVVLDEYADMDPRLWSEVIRPALADRSGWAVFIGTPRGRNEFYQTWMRAQADPANWFALMLKASETGLIPQGELDLARRELSEEQYAQEFECSFDAAIVGSYYGKLMADAERDKRICGVGHDASAAVWTAWDLGMRDATAIWFAQAAGREVHVLDYYEASGVDLGHYVREIMWRAYTYAGHIVPHDAQAKELGTGKSRLEVLESLGLKNLTIAPAHRIEDGINAVRVFLPKCWFDAQKCTRGIDALKLYRSEYDEKLQVLRPRPVHDWASHAADAFRYLAMTLDRTVLRKGFNKRIEYPETGVV